MTIATKGGDAVVDALFGGGVERYTATPGARAWLMRDEDGIERYLKRIPTEGNSRGRLTQALALRHNGAARTRRWLAAEGAIYVVRDLVVGRSLYDKLAEMRGQQDARSVEEWTLPVMEALSYAHSGGAAHGGVSLYNILLTRDNRPVLTDFGTANPAAPQHKGVYEGNATVAGDIRAMGNVLRTLLPRSGVFGDNNVRARIERMIEQSDSLGDLKSVVQTLEKLAGSGGGRSGTTAPMPTGAGRERGAKEAVKLTPFPPNNPRLTILAPPSQVVGEGGGGTATVTLKNEGDRPLSVRGIATQHNWLNVRPLELPLSVEAGKEARVLFVISTARLKPGEYRSEIYVTANAPALLAESVAEGLWRHTFELRVTVDGGGAFPVR